jgi:uncharacterized cupin superfamily protein
MASGNEPLILLEGGERRPKEDGGWYVDARKLWRAGGFIEPYEPPPAELGDERQVVHVDEIEITTFQHDVDPKARRRMRALHTPTGLDRQAVRWATVAAGDLSTALHTHDRTDEWVLILSGRARARIGDSEIDVGPNEFIGHRAGSPAHVMKAVDELTYLMGGEVDSADIVTYPEARLRRVARKLEPLR